MSGTLGGHEQHPYLLPLLAWVESTVASLSCRHPSLSQERELAGLRAPGVPISVVELLFNELCQLVDENQPVYLSGFSNLL